MTKEEPGAGMDKLTMDLRLIPEFDGATLPVAEWLEKVELVCQLPGITDLQNTVPLRLTGGAFSVCQQLGSADKGSYEKIKTALISAFAVDKFIACERFVGRRLRDGESANVYLADLRHLGVLFGGIPDAGLGCAFVAGLPDYVRHILRAGSRLEDMDLTQILARTRAILAKRHVGAAATSVSSPQQHKATPASAGVLCRACSQPNHYARDCLARRDWRRGGRSNMHGHGCEQSGRSAPSCPGNGLGEATAAPAISPDCQ